MYYIYHIPDVKIGCTAQDVKKRVKDQGYSDYEVLEVHSCIDTASDRELQLQKEYGYKVDRIAFKQSYNHFSKMHTYRKSLEYLKDVGKKNYIYMTKGKTKKQISKERSKAAYIGMQKSIKRSREVNSKPVLQFDLDGNFLYEYPSITDARIKTKTSKISDVCRGKAKTAGGFIWKYKN